jgi:tripartite-type tricarboxylate transporter receptor subunit TctC
MQRKTAFPYGCTVWLLMSLMLAAPAWSAYPERPVRMIVPQAVGASTDNVARIVATELARELGQQVVVDNRPGGALQLGMELTARATRDGYTIGYAPIGSLAIGPHLVSKPPIDALRELAPVGQTITGHMMVLASPKSPFRTMREVIDYAKQNPGKLFNASSSNGSPGHIGFELLKNMTGIQIVHVPYKGGGPMTVAVIGGQIDLGIGSTALVTPFANDGRMRVLATTGDARSVTLPNVPTLIEEGYKDVTAYAWWGIFAPARTPPAIINKLHGEMVKVLNLPDVRRHLGEQLGMELMVSTPAELQKWTAAELTRWSKVIRDNNIKP